MATNVGHIACRVVVAAQRETPILRVAQLMRDHHIGTVIIIEDEPPLNRPIGIITDRDLVIEVMALELDYRAFTAGDIMTANPSTVRETDAVFDAFEQMQRSAVRRLPVVDATGRLVAVGTSCRMRRVASRPFIPGRLTSIRMTSGVSCLASCTATFPSHASPTISMSPISLRRRHRPARTTLWSSTTRARSFIGPCFQKMVMGRAQRRATSEQQANARDRCVACDTNQPQYQGARCETHHFQRRWLAECGQIGDELPDRDHCCDFPDPRISIPRKAIQGIR